MFNPGETVLHRFIIPFIPNEISKVIVTYKQEDDVVFEKTITSGFEGLESNTKTQFTVDFSQDESLLFKDLYNYTAQVNVLTIHGTRASSKPIKGFNGSQYHREVILS